MQQVFNKIIFSVLLFLACSRSIISSSRLKSSKLKLCPHEKTISNGTFEWKFNHKDDLKYVISEPDVCWHNNTIVLRQCNLENGQWLPHQVQCSKFQSRNRKCPDDLIELMVNEEYVCLKISPEKQTFDEHFCYGTNHIIGYDDDKYAINNEILKFLLEKFAINSFWMPVKRYEDKEFSPFVIRLPGEYWNDLFSYRDLLLSMNNQNLADKHCAVSFIQKANVKQNKLAIQMAMTHCKEMHYAVCVVRKHFVARSGCPQDFGALSHRPNECYGIALDGQKYPEDFRMLNVKEFFIKLNTINNIFEELDIVNDKYVEVEGAVEIFGGKWAIKPKNNEMKIVPSSKQLHGLCVEYIESRKNVEMMLRMDPDLDALILTVYHKFYIWSNKDPEDSIYCFTNADYEELAKVELKKIWENEAQTKTIFKLKTKSNDPGQYWCEAHTIFNFSHVTSPKVIAAKLRKGHVFAMQAEIPLLYTRNNNFPITFTADEMKDMAVYLRKDMKNVRKKQRNLNELVIHNVRIMDIIYIQPSALYLQCICHVTVSMKSSAMDISKEQNSHDDNSIEKPEGLHLNITALMKARDLLIDLMQEYQPQFAHTVQSIEFCFPAKQWLLARLGQAATKSQLCLQRNGLPITRRCLGDFIGGAYWQQISAQDCLNVKESNLITTNLHSLEQTTTLDKTDTEKTFRNVRKLLAKNLKNIIPADLYYLAQIIHNSIESLLRTHTKPLTPEIHSHLKNSFSDLIAQQPTTTVQNFSDITVEIIRIYNFLLEVEENVVTASIALNSTNILLDAFEHLIDHLSSVETFSENIAGNYFLNQDDDDDDDDDDQDIEIIEYLDVGVVVKRASNFLVFVINPQVANVTGMALFRTDLSSCAEFCDVIISNGALSNHYYRFILANQSVSELLNEENISMATYIPTALWQRLDEISTLSNSTRQVLRPEAKVVIKIYANDKLFRETNATADKVVKGNIISISIPGHDKDLPEVLPLILTVNSAANGGILDSYNDLQREQQFCGYWNYQTWANDGVMFINRSEINKNTILCGCTHLTPFAYLIGGSYKLSIDSAEEVIVKRIHKQALDIITILGCSLSLFGIAGIFLTACIFQSWRNKANSKVLLQLSAAIALEMVLFCFVNTEEISRHLISNKIYTSCIAIGACLHYSVLVQFCWMVIIAYLQFKRYVQVFGKTRPKHFFLISTILGWGLPLVPVACVLLFDSDSYIPENEDSSYTLCYPSHISFYAGIALPITLVIVANLVIFFTVIYNVLKSPAIRRTERSLALSQIRLLVLLFFLLGLTWIFGLLNAMKAGLVFSYLFCLTATLQGFVLFIYFIVMDPVTRRMWQGYFVKLCGLKLNIQNSSLTKESTGSN